MANRFVFVLCFSAASILADNSTTRGYLIVNMTGLMGHTLDGYSFYLAGEDGHRVLLRRINELPTEVAGEQFTQDSEYFGNHFFGSIAGEYYTRTFSHSHIFSFDLPAHYPYQSVDSQDPQSSYYQLLYLDNAGNHPHSFVNSAFRPDRNSLPLTVLYQFTGSDLMLRANRWYGYTGSPAVYFPDEQDNSRRTLYTTLILPSANISQSFPEGYNRSPADNSYRHCESLSW
ncbi:hypothetical protein NX722_26810 [Endozoicomonas gorgoniicola]|uniref:Uncharacterized protein n=1 Tax=Endozoicomonas gorgoniicola TaxID=1234144 RepID=A0ABT3N3G8_9GAMM|nr:hypothetical protein [Endozoicomonas gorgoniicola]MCW7556174.1 hypothetical protein [Endozoicomonas gorgoniicola]